MFDKRQYLNKYCDIQTKDGIWRLGIIEGDKLSKIEKNVIEVSLDGWSSNKNNKICLHSNRIQPPRFYSREYTGQASYPLRNFNIDMMQISYIENWLKLFYKFDFQKFPILDITNLFRCQMFILVDSILFLQWDYFNESIDENFKKIEAFFNNIVQFSVLYLENMPKFISEIYDLNYERNSYLQSLPVSYLEASYELFKILKNIFGFSERTQNFFSEYSGLIKSNFLNYFIDIGCMNLFSRFFREYKTNKLYKIFFKYFLFRFEEKFYIMANILNLNLLIINTSNHNKLNKTNQFKYITEIVDFLYRENFIAMINKNIEDPDVIQFVDSIVQFSKMNKKFVRESQRFEIFLHNINKFDVVFRDNDRRMSSEKHYGNYQFLQGISSKNLAHIPSTITNNENFLNKLNEIDNKLSILETRIISTNSPTKRNSTRNLKNNNQDYQKTTTTEFFIVSPSKSVLKSERKKSQEFEFDTNIDNVIMNPVNSYIAISDPFDEFAILNVIEKHLNCEMPDKNYILKIIKWRKKILDVSKSNGWIVGKILAANTVKKFDVNDKDIIQANFIYMEKFNLIDKQNLKIDYKEVLNEYEEMLINSLKEMSI